MICTQHAWTLHIGMIQETFCPRHCILIHKTVPKAWVWSLLVFALRGAVTGCSELQGFWEDHFQIPVARTKTYRSIIDLVTSRARQHKLIANKGLRSRADSRICHRPSLHKRIHQCWVEYIEPRLKEKCKQVACILGLIYHSWRPLLHCRASARAALLWIAQAHMCKNYHSNDRVMWGAMPSYKKNKLHVHIWRGSHGPLLTEIRESWM